MRKVILILALLGCIGVSQSYAQCDVSVHKGACLKKIPEYFVFSKSYNLVAQASEFSNIFHKHKAYIVIASDKKIKIEIISKAHKKTIRSGNGYVSFIPLKTASYIIRFSFEEEEVYCGAAVLSFLR